MSREKIDTPANRQKIYETFGSIQLIPLLGVAEFCGVDVRTLKRDSTFPLKKIGGRYYVPAESLARWLS